MTELQDKTFQTKSNKYLSVPGIEGNLQTKFDGHIYQKTIAIKCQFGQLSPTGMPWIHGLHCIYVHAQICKYNSHVGRSTRAI